MSEHQITVEQLMDQIVSCEASAWMCDMEPSKIHDAVRKHMREMLEQFAAQQRADAAQQLQRENADYQESQQDHIRIVRELDVLWNGEEGAAKQASLCDVFLQIRNELPQLRAELAAANSDKARLSAKLYDTGTELAAAKQQLAEAEKDAQKWYGEAVVMHSAALKYANNYLMDELDEPELCIDEQHHADVREFWEAIQSAPIDAATAQAGEK